MQKHAVEAPLLKYQQDTSHMQYRVLELFSGNGSVKHLLHPFLHKVHVTTLDVEPKYKADIQVDITKWDYKTLPPKYFDFIWASPDCSQYSSAHITGTPADTAHSDRLIKQTLRIVDYFKPSVWFIENPLNTKLKDKPFMKKLPYHDVTYCMYGFPYRKPTRIWTNLSAEEFTPRFCHNDCPMRYADKRHILILGMHIPGYCPLAHRTCLPVRVKMLVPQRLLRDLFSAALRQINDEQFAKSLRSKPIRELVDWKKHIKST